MSSGMNIPELAKVTNSLGLAPEFEVLVFRFASSSVPVPLYSNRESSDRQHMVPIECFLGRSQAELHL